MSQPVDSVSVEIVYDTSQSLSRLKSEIDSALRSVMREFDQAFEQIERHASGAGSDIGREISQGGEHAEGAIREVERQARSSFNRVSREATEAGNSIERKLGGALKGLAALGVGAAVATGLTLLTTSGLSAAASLEQTQVAFSSLLGSAEEGQRVFDGLKQFAATTPFELADITGAAQRFLAFNDAVGIADAQLQPFLTTLGNIASVTGAGAFGVDRVTTALGQISSKGKVSLEELLQISEALPGFSAVAAIAAARGTTTAQAMEDISAGVVPATEGVKALLDGMAKFPGAAGAMEAQSQTLLGVFSTFKDTVSQALAGAFDPVIPALKAAVTEVTPVLGDALGQLAPQIGTGLTQIIAALIPAIKPLASILATTLDAISPFIDILGQILTPVLEALVPVFDALNPVIKELATPIQDLIVALLPILPALSGILVAVIAVAAPLLKLVGILVSFLAQKSIAPLVQLLAEGLGFLAEAVRQFGVWLTTVDWGSVLGAIGSFFADVGKAIAGFFVAIWDWLFALPRRTTEAFVEFAQVILDKLLDLLRWFRELPGKILAAIGGLAGKMIEKGKEIIRGLWSGISSLGGWLWDKITSFVSSNIIDPIKGALGIASPSRVMAEQVGRWIPAGIQEGIEGGSSLDQLRGLIDSLVTPGAAAASGPTGGSGGVIFGPGSVIMQFSGALPTPAQAGALAEASMSGIGRAIQRGNTRTAMRMV